MYDILKSVFHVRRDTIIGLKVDVMKIRYMEKKYFYDFKTWNDIVKMTKILVWSDH